MVHVDLGMDSLSGTPLFPHLWLLRWRIERDCQEFKQELALGRCEGRGWRASTSTPASASPPADSRSP